MDKLIFIRQEYSQFLRHGHIITCRLLFSVVKYYKKKTDVLYKYKTFETKKDNTNSTNNTIIII